MAEGEKYRLEAAQVLGATNGNFLSQAGVFVPHDEEKKKKCGSLLVVFSLKGASLDQEWGKELLTRFQEEYFGPETGWPMERLTASLKKIAHEVEENRLSSEFEAVAAVLWQNVWYFASWGRGKVLVRRGPTIAAALVGKEKEVVSASGPAEEGDLILLALADFLSVIKGEKMEKILNLAGEEAVAEALSTQVAKEEGQDKALAALVAQLKPINKKEEEEGQKKEKKKFLFSLSSPEKWQKYRWLFLGGLVFLILGLGGLIFSWQKKRVSLKEKEWLRQAQEEYDQAITTADLDSSQAEVFLKEAEELLEKIKGKGVKKEEVDSLKEKVAQLRKELGTEKEETVSLPVFWEPNSEKEKVNISLLASLGKAIFILDKEKQQILRLDWEEKDIKVVLGDEKLSRAERFFPQAEGTLVLLDDGLYQIIKTNLEKMVEKDKSWQEISALSGWLGNAYLLDSGADQIWQYPATTKGLGAKRAWLKEDGQNFSSQAQMFIDGSIFIVDRGHLYRYYKGYQKDDFSLSDLGDKVLVAGNSDGDLLYILDLDHHDLFLVTKEDGQIKKKIAVPTFNEVKGMVVSPDETVVLLATKDKIYQINLRAE